MGETGRADRNAGTTQDQEGVSSAAPGAESLMRSRYSAFVLQRRDDLLATWHATTRPPELDFEAGA